MKLDESHRMWIPKETDRLCSLHFKEECFRQNTRRSVLSTNAISSIFSHTKEVNNPSERQIRYEQNYGQMPVLLQQPTSSRVAEYTCKKELHNVKRREKRLRLTVVSLKERLKEELKVKESLLRRLEAFKGEELKISY